ncbi:uncharacterized protein LOC142230948 [Haematobia irritans]|uniref:uncharacterized protein LOC142230948 n=1 Tax=Haematobia irritans TaxID=7368 RepID=UPI003F5096BC
MGGSIVANSNSSCNLVLFSSKYDKYVNIQAIVVPKITRLLANFVLPKSKYPMEEIRDMELADPDFHSPAQVDLLIGSNALPELLLEGVKKIGGSLIAQSTIFGWVISGPVSTEMISSLSLEVNEFPPPVSADDEFCESLYDTTTARNSEGRYIVRLPFKSNFSVNIPIGSSRPSALAQYTCQESVFRRHPEMHEEYSKILNEYLTLGHAEPTSSKEVIVKNSFRSFYLPHHAVYKPDSTSTKTRVVFHASKRSNSGNSLNDILHIGPRLQYFALKTVTFGVDCAPYLAIRTLIQLARDGKEKFPQASQILLKEIYVDDIWSEKLLHSDFLKLQEESTTKTLGTEWNALSDCFSYKINPISPTTTITKRKLLSLASKLFDPAGWISPIIVQAKLLLQQIWLDGTDWDEDAKPHTTQKWNRFVTELSSISLIEIPRWIHFSPRCQTQLHGFCDASQKSYCAVVYIRIQNPDSVHTSILISKTRVAPIEPISLPRLELCGAVLLAKLVKTLLITIPVPNSDITLWCDSSIVLSWLEKTPSVWKTYIANRTAQIIRDVGNTKWRHVRSMDNPADLGSRGCTPMDLADNSLWWYGPSWLDKPQKEWPL